MSRRPTPSLNRHLRRFAQGQSPARSSRHSRCGRANGCFCAHSTSGRRSLMPAPQTNSPYKRFGRSVHTNTRPTDMLYIVPLLLGLGGGATPPAPVKVVTSLTTYAAIAREIVGDPGEVSAIAQGDENPHYVQPKPSFVPLLARAEVFVTTRLNLGLWVALVLYMAGNFKVPEGSLGCA